MLNKSRAHRAWAWARVASGLLAASSSACAGWEPPPAMTPSGGAQAAPEPAPDAEPEPEPESEPESEPEPEREQEVSSRLTTGIGGAGVYQWAAKARWDRAFRWRGALSLFGEAQRDFIPTDLGPPGNEVFRGGAALRLGRATLGVKANLFPRRQPFPEPFDRGVLVDLVGHYVLPLDELGLALRVSGGLNAEWADRWNGVAYAKAERALTLQALSWRAPDIGTLNLLGIATATTGDRYRPSILGLALYDMPAGLPAGLSGLYALYGYATAAGEGTPWGRIGYSKAYEITGFKKGVWTKHVLGLGWAYSVPNVQRGRLSNLYIGAQYIWGLDDGFRGPAGSPRDAAPTAYGGGLGDLAFLVWWVELQFDVRRRATGPKPSGGP